MQDKIYDQREETYGTRGVDDYRAKDSAQKNIAMNRAAGAVSGGGQLLQGATNAVREETLCEQVIRELEIALEILRDTSSSQDCLHARIFGEQPADPKTGSDFSGNGTSGAIKERLLWLRGLALQVRDNQVILSQRIA